MSVEPWRLRVGELVAGVSAVLLLVFMFLPWYGVKVALFHGPGATLVGADVDAWSAFTVLDIYLLLTSLVALALVAFQMTRRAPAIPVSLSIITTVLGAVAVLLILIRILDPPGVSGLPALVASRLERTVKVGVFLGLLAALGITVGGWTSLREEGVRPEDGPRHIEIVRDPGSS